MAAEAGRTFIMHWIKHLIAIATNTCCPEIHAALLMVFLQYFVIFSYCAFRSAGMS